MILILLLAHFEKFQHLTRVTRRSNSRRERERVRGPRGGSPHFITAVKRTEMSRPLNNKITPYGAVDGLLSTSEEADFS